MPTLANSIAKNTTWLTLSYIFQKILAFIYFTLIARYIGANDIGIYTFAISLTTIVSIFIDLGLSNVLIREAAKDKDKTNQYLNNIITLKVILAVLAYLLVFVIINLLHKSPLTMTMVYIAGLVMVLDSFTLTFFAVFRAWQNLKYESLGIAIGQILILVIGLLGTYLGSPLYILILALLAGSFFNFLYSLILLSSKLQLHLRLNWQKTILLPLLKIAIPFALAGIFVRIYSYIDQVLLSILIGDKYLGWYSVPYKITFALQFIPAAFAAAIYPAMSEYYKNAKDKLANIYEKSMYFLLLLALPTAFGTALLADKLINFLYTSEYQPSILALQIMIFSVIPIFVGYPIGSLLNACDKQGKNTLNMGLTMVLNIVLNIILIPRYQHNGAAFAALISQFALIALNLYWVPKIIKYNRNFLLLKLGQGLLASLVMAAIILLLTPYLNFLLIIIIAGLAYIGVLFLIKGFGWADIMYLKNSIIKPNPVVYEEKLTDNN